MSHDEQQIVLQHTSSYPVDLVALAKSLGLRIFMDRSFKDSKSGEIVKTGANQFRIYLNANHSSNRNRFTLAHEIAHYLAHKEKMQTDKPVEDFIGQTFAISLSRKADQPQDRLEVEANALAADLIMPQTEFIKIWNDKSTIQEVADYFEVSKEAAEVRARVLSERLNDGHIQKN